MNKKTLGTLFLATIATALLTVTLVMPVAGATALAGETRFAAGDFADGICDCPVTVGDCVCKFTDPEEN